VQPSSVERRRDLAAFCFGLALSFATAEIVLRIPGLPLQAELGAKLFSCYEEGRHHITFFEPTTAIKLHKPGFETECRFGELRWNHRGDRWGFRNPESWERVDVALLGDSFVYGHGVEEHETIAHFMREQTRLRVANLGVTGGSPVEYLVYLRNFALRLAPRVVVVLTFANDIDDISEKRGRVALEKFANGENAPELAISKPETMFRAASQDESPAAERLLRWSLTYQTWEFYRPRLSAWLSGSVVAHQDEPPPGPMQIRKRKNKDRPAGDAPREEDTGDPLAVAYAKRAFRVMADSTRAAGATLVIAYIPARRQRDPFLNPGMEWLLGNIARENHIGFLDLAPVLSGPDGNPLPGDRIPDDGHFSAQGAARASRAIVEYLRGERMMQ
jgi:hypothetical protein